MSEPTVAELLRRRQTEYERASKGRRGELLDELVELTGWHRKSLIRRLAQPAAPSRSRRSPPPRISRYAPALGPLRKLWAASFYPCGKRLQPFLPELLDVLVRHGELQVTPTQEALLRQISAATIDRLLAPDRQPHPLRGRSTTKPGTLLKSQIPIRTFADWDEQQPGFCEVDLVAHCGDSGKGEFLYTLNLTDVYTGWTVLAGMRGRGERGTVAALQAARRALPFSLRGLDSDNDSAFINSHLLRYCQREQITFTRCRPYRKNDQCHVEQKNWSLIRQFVGYVRLETEAELAHLQQLYEVLGDWHNFFSPMLRLRHKERQGSRVKKQYEPAQTPYRRLLAVDDALTATEQEALARRYQALNPAAQLRQILAWVEELEGLAATRGEA